MNSSVKARRGAVKSRAGGKTWKLWERRFFLNKMVDRNTRNSLAIPFGSKENHMISPKMKTEVRRRDFYQTVKDSASRCGKLFTPVASISINCGVQRYDIRPSSWEAAAQSALNQILSCTNKCWHCQFVLAWLNDKADVSILKKFNYKTFN